MNARERFSLTVHFGKPDRVPNEEFGYWSETVERWQREGLPVMDVESYFHLDPRREWYLLTWPLCDCLNATDVNYFNSPIYLGPIPSFESRILTEDEATQVVSDEWGRMKRIRKRMGTIPQYLEFPVKTVKDFGEFKKRLSPTDSGRFPKNWRTRVKVYETRDYPLGINLLGFFGFPRILMGTRNLSIAYHKDPELVTAIVEYWCDFQIEICKSILDDVEVDFVQIWEDMAYNKGPIISPKLFCKFELPCYKKLIRVLQEYGVDVFMVDSDGNINDLIPFFLETGVNGFYPLEVRASMDPLEIRRKNSKVILCGGIDKFALVKGPQAIEKELNSKLPVLVPQGGYIPSLDHRVPLDVSLSNYRYYVELKTALITELAES